MGLFLGDIGRSGCSEGSGRNGRLFTLDKVACLGCCSLAPVMMIDEHTVGKLSPATACEALLAVEPEPSE